MLWSFPFCFSAVLVVALSSGLLPSRSQHLPAFLDTTFIKEKGEIVGQVFKGKHSYTSFNRFSSCLISKNCFICPERKMPLLWLGGQLRSTFQRILFLSFIDVMSRNIVPRINDAFFSFLKTSPICSILYILYCNSSSLLFFFNSCSV